MKKYNAVKGNEVMSFNDKEGAVNFVESNQGWEYEETNEWKYYNPHSRNFLSKYESIKGKNIKDAIEQSFVEIAKNNGLYGASGYSLDSATLTDNNDSTATLNIKGWNFSDALVDFDETMLNDENKKDINVKLEGVVEGDIPNGTIKFDVVKERQK